MSPRWRNRPARGSLAWVLVGLLAALGPEPASAEPPRDPLPVLWIGSGALAPGGERAGARGAQLLEAARLFDFRPRGWGALTRDELAGAPSIVLAAPAPAGAAVPFEAFERLVAGGATLVLLGDAVESWPGTPAADLLLGRRAERAEAPARRQASLLHIAVLDQSHPVTQCVSHFRHRGRLPLARPTEQSRVYASARRAPQPAEGAESDASAAAELVPVIWGGRSGNGRVLVSAIEPDGGPADALLAVLLGRTLEWGAGVGPSLKLPSDAPWLSSDAAWDGRGFLPGLPEREGFFMGRQIAPFMSYLGADWLTRPDREEAEQPERVLDELKVAPGSAVADLGAGNGYFTLRLARRVGASGRVLAVEIQQEMLDLLKIRMEKEALKNIDLVLSTENDPRLAPASVDLVLMVDVYHELSDPRAVLATVRKALRPKGRIALVEYRGEDPGVQIKPAHRTTEAQVRGELRALGFRWLRTHEFLRNQRILEFAAQE